MAFDQVKCDASVISFLSLNKFCLLERAFQHSFFTLSCRALIVCATCESVVFINLLSWLPSYFHDEFPESKVRFVAQFVVQSVMQKLFKVAVVMMAMK